jgi:hypothetical protein
MATCLASISIQWSLSGVRAEDSKPVKLWAVAAVLTNGQYTGSAIYLTLDLVITAAHVAGVGRAIFKPTLLAPMCRRRT